MHQVNALNWTECWCLSSKLSPVSADLIHKTHQNISSYALDLSHFTCKKIYKFLSVSSPPQPVGPKKYVCLFVFVFICLYLFILQAEAALQRGEVPVGCLLVHKNKTVIGTGKNCVNETKNVSIVSITLLLKWIIWNFKTYFCTSVDTKPKLVQNDIYFWVM